MEKLLQFFIDLVDLSHIHTIHKLLAYNTTRTAEISKGFRYVLFSAREELHISVLDAEYSYQICISSLILFSMLIFVPAVPLYVFAWALLYLCTIFHGMESKNCPRFATHF